ncbi:hypothetical protein [Undibacterium flavidum]|uniref:RDD family protein n=1 Tax=Undibacterium flavidum TaxID=2762297 RepID=A0ABR6YEZ1_9BURK|nr:hypothetical protein [Undibacterium flavidum]MBC3875125.1 hypothetical protein [Undibacterium flavidum]
MPLISIEYPEFMPRQEVLKAQTWCRRSPLPHPIGRLGLLGEDHVGRDYALFSAVLIAEFVGMFLITRYMPTSVAVGLAFGALMLDLVFAFWHHRQTCPRILEVKEYVADIEVSDDRAPTAVSGGYAERISRRNAIGIIPTIVLVLITVLKVFAYYRIGGQKIDSSLFAMTIVYVATCIVHLYITGYVLAHLWASGWFGIWGFSKDLSRYKSNSKDTRYLASARSFPQKISGDAALRIALKKVPAPKSEETFAQHRAHKIIFNREENGSWALYLKPLGAIYDQDIVGLMNIFSQSEYASAAQTEVAKAALFIQSHRII